MAAAWYFGLNSPQPPASSAAGGAPASPAQTPELVSAPTPGSEEPTSPEPQVLPTSSNSVSPVLTQPQDPNPHRHLKRFFKTRLGPSLKEIARDFQAGRPARISVPLFDGKEALVVVDNFTPYGEKAGAFSGKIEGDPGSFVNISFYEDAESGSIQFPAQNLVYTIQPEPDGSVVIGEVDVAALGTCGTCRGSVSIPGP